jgi:aminoglycoside phosphotransferase (APT) family kinase protein
MSFDACAPAVIAWIEAAGAARVVRVREMPPSSTAKHVVEIERDGSIRRLVLRRYTNRERLASDVWYVPANEAAALRVLEAHGVPAPRLVASDLDAEVLDVPALLETWIAGEPACRPRDLDAYLADAARISIAIHAVDARGSVPAYEPYYAPEDIQAPEWSNDRAVWEAVREAISAPPPPARACLIHRDYHPGNVLSDRGRVTGVVDWATAAWGPPGIDLARMRQNLVWDVGTGPADAFLRAYAAAGGDPGDRHFHWDLLDAADSLPDLRPPANAREAAAFERFERWVASLLRAI